MLRLVRRVVTGQENIREIAWAANFILSRRDLDWYLDLFPEDCISGDISPAHHMLDDNEIEQVKATLPELKIVILFRNPYDQIWSHCRMSARHVRPENRIKFYKEHIDYQLDLCSSFAELVIRWRGVFGRENVLIEYLENMIRWPELVANRIVAFVDPGAKTSNRLKPVEETPRVFAGPKVEIPEALHPIILRAARTRLKGFERIDSEMALRWHIELDELANAG